MSKTNKPSTETKKKSIKVARWRSQVYDFTIGRMKPINDSTLEDLALEIVNWALQQEHEPRPKTKLKDYYALKGMAPMSFHKFCDRFEPLKEAREQAKMILGNLRENGVNRKEFAHILIAKNLYQYDSDWDAADQRWAQFTSQEKNDFMTKFIGSKFESPPVTKKQKKDA